MLTKMRIAKAIRYHRQRSGWSQNEAGRQSGLRPSTWCDLEQGKLNPTIKTLDVIAHTLQVDIGELFEIQHNYNADIISAK
jgi:transcriptional regulator with XRE-family HTH domain